MISLPLFLPGQFLWGISRGCKRGDYSELCRHNCDTARIYWTSILLLEFGQLGLFDKPPWYLLGFAVGHLPQIMIWFRA